MYSSLLNLFVCGLCLLRVQGDKEIIYKVPEEGKKWSWTTKGSSWEEPIGFNGERSYTICTAPGAESTPNNWLIWKAVTPKEPNVTRLDLDITVAVQNCSTIPGGPHEHCKHFFDVYQYEFDDTSNPRPPLVEKFTNKIATVTVSGSYLSKTKPGKSKTRYSKRIEAYIRKAGVFFAIHDSGVCMSIFSVAVSYRVCSSKPENFVTFMEKISPPDSSTRLRVGGKCVANAVTAGVAGLYAYCQSSGNWSLGPRVGCKCDVGYQPKNGYCEACPKSLNTYKNFKGNIPCIKCPAHSTQHHEKTKCKCNRGFYRAVDEDITYNCTGIPSKPTALNIIIRNATSISLTWKRPLDTGGRDDLHFRVECSKCSERSCDKKCDKDTLFKPAQSGLKTLYVKVMRLKPFTKYKFKVFSNNGVTSRANDEKSAEESIITDESVPGMPIVTDVARSSDSRSVHLKWDLEQKNGKILYYTVVYYQEGRRNAVQTRNTTHMNITLTGLDPDSSYVFEVKAATSQGYGPYSTSAAARNRRGKGVLDFFEKYKPYIIGGVAATVLILIIIIVVVACKTRRGNGLQHLDKEGHELLPLAGQRLYIDPSTYGDVLDALRTFATEIDKSSLKAEKLIGGGEFGEVYRGTLSMEDGQTETVAIKTLKSSASMKNRDDFLSEASIMGQFDHPNVVQLKGVITKVSPLMIVLEFMESGSLDHFLRDHDGELTSLQLLGMARGVASGMAYLADMSFIHRDLAARNILVSENMVCKVADFGLSRELEEDNPDSEYQTQGGKIPVRWTAPEAIRYKRFSTASDVWSYGILLWEIMSFGDRPYWEWSNFEVMDRVETGYRLPMPMRCPKIIHDLMLRCWEKERTKRPKFCEIVKRLDELIRSPDKLMDYVTTPTQKTFTDFDALQSVPDWLETINMSKYADQFTGAGYEKLEHLCRITDCDLDKIGIKLIGHRNKIRKSIKVLKDHYRKKRGSYA